MAGRSTWDLDEFNGGIDLRDGLFSSNQTRFRELENCWIDKGRKLRRRPPCLELTGDLDPNSQGLLSIDGQYYTIAKKGDTIVHTGEVAALVQTLYFDAPDYSTTWTLLAAGTFDGYAAVYIRHTYPSVAYPSFVALHVWDGLVFAPTWVQDPYFPGSFSPSIADLTDQRFDAGFVPAYGLGVSKLWTSTLRGNTQSSRTADARVWNQRTDDSLLQDGEHWCFIVPEGNLVQRSFLVPRNADWMPLDGRWAYYVLEYDNDGEWTPMEEVAVTPTVGFTWKPTSVASRFAGGWNEIRIDVCWGRAAAGLLRLRLVAGSTAVDVTQAPTVEATASSGSAWKLSIGEARYRYRGGDGVTVAAHTTADLVEGKTYLLGVTADGTGFPELINLTDDGFPNGWGREHRKLVKTIVTAASLTGFTLINTPWKTFVAATGTVTVSGGSTAVVGVGTSFLSQVKVGSTIRVAGVERVVGSITDNLNLNVTVNWPGASAGVAWDVVYGYATFTASKTHVYVDATLAAALAVGNTLRINAQDYQVSAIAGQDITITQGGVDGDYTGNVNQFWNPIYRTNQPSITAYLYAYESNADSEWYTDRIVEYVDLAGAEDALGLNTASHDNTGGLVTSITTVRNRMLISYAGSLQLWEVDQDTNRTRHLDDLSFGTGGQVTPSPVDWYGAVVLPMVTGFRAISVIGANTDNLQDLNIGEPIDALEMLDVRSASFWPWYGQLIIAGMRGSDLVMLCLDYSRESKITAWSEWIVAGVTDVDAGTLTPDQGKLRFRCGTKVRHFDAQATVFRDFADTPGAAYESRGVFHFNDLGKPGANKRWTALDIVQDGTCDLSFELTPYGSYAEAGGPTLSGPRITGITYGRSRFPMALTGTAIAPRFSTRDETGWRLQRLALDFLLLRR